MKPAELTPEIVRKFCRMIGGSTNGQAADVEDACARFLAGEADEDQLIVTIREEIYFDEQEDAEKELLGSMAQTYGGPDD